MYDWETRLLEAVPLTPLPDTSEGFKVFTRTWELDTLASDSQNDPLSLPRLLENRWFSTGGMLASALGAGCRQHISVNESHQN